MADMKRILDTLSGLMTATDIGDDAFAVIAEAIADRDKREATAIGTTAATIVVINTAYCVHRDTGRAPREIITTMLHAALEAFPEEAPKADDIPAVKRAVKPGPSPWGNVR